MKPEERAARILQDYRHAAGRPIQQPLFLGRSIAAAIRAAVEAEREACARSICYRCQDNELPVYDGRFFAYYHGSELCEASTIRARSEGGSQ